LRAAAGALVVFGVFAACAQDDISGPVDQIGPPLLDMELQPAAAAPFGGNTVTRVTTGDTLHITLTNLPAVPTGTVYQVLLVDSAAATNNATVATGRLITTRTVVRPIDRDRSVTRVVADTVAATSSIAPTESNTTINFRITNASLGGSIAAYTHAVVVVSTTPAAGTITLGPDEQRGFLARRTTTGSFTTGTWSINSALRRPYSIQGSGISAFIGDPVIDGGTDFRATFERILRPPEGFRYVGYLIDERTGINYRLGGLLTPVPENRALTNADTESGSFLTDVAIVNSQLRSPVDDADNYTRFALVLEPKGAAGLTRAPLTEVLNGAVPTSVGSRHPGAGKLYGKVTGGSVDSATVFLTGVGLNTPLAVRNAAAHGDFAFRTVPIGSYTVNVIPWGDSVVRASQNVTIGVNPATSAGDSVFVTLAIP
jgi:hypothetical protein